VEQVLVVLVELASESHHELCLEFGQIWKRRQELQKLMPETISAMKTMDLGHETKDLGLMS
jgi:hypothetical protein